MVWYKGDEPVDLNDTRYRITRTLGIHNLEITNADISDSCKWRVVGVNKLGSSETSCNITVERKPVQINNVLLSPTIKLTELAVPDGFIKPNFLEPLQDVKIHEGSAARLSVHVQAHPIPDIIWYKEGKELQHGHHYQLSYDDEELQYTLTLLHAYAEDAGDYRCVAVNLCGSAQTECSLRIFGTDSKGSSSKLHLFTFFFSFLDVTGVERRRTPDPTKAPKFRLPLKNRVVPAGFGLSLVCSVTGSPTPKITWLRGDKVLPPSDYDIRFEDGLCQLNIETFGRTDIGEYTCVAENENGTARTMGVITVAGKQLLLFPRKN